MAINLTGSTERLGAHKSSGRPRLLPKGHLANLLLTLTLLLASFAGQASLLTSVDRRQVSDADLLILKVRLENAGTNTAPDFSVLEQDFEIVSINGPQSTSRTSIINGNTTAEVYVLWELSLRARRLGQLIVPSLFVGNQQSSPIVVNVVRQTAEMQRQTSQYVFFETTVDTQDTYVQGQILYTVKLFYVDAVSGDFPPPPALTDAVIEAIEGEQRYETLVNNRRYYVLEKRYAIFPQKSGELIIPRETFAGSRGSNRFFSTGERVMAISNPHTINVKAKPASFPDANWLPAKGLALTEGWSQTPPTFTVGEPINRTLTLIVDGVAGSLLPPMTPLTLDKAKTYEDPPTVTEATTTNGIVATQTYTIGIVPTAAGTLELPAIRLYWWNTETDALAYSELPAASFTVKASTSTPASIPSLTPVVPPAAVAAASNASPQPQNRWALISHVLVVVFALLWLITLGLWWRSRQTHSQSGKPETPSIATPNTAPLTQLTHACRQGQASAARQALFLWGIEQDPSINSLHELGLHLQSPALITEIDNLERSIYAEGNHEDWDGSALLNIVKSLRQRPKTPKQQTSLVPTMNPSGGR
ncbi:MAG: BatD family protein [SAR86 cluster bacterium]